MEDNYKVFGWSKQCREWLEIATHRAPNKEEAILKVRRYIRAKWADRDMFSDYLAISFSELRQFSKKSSIPVVQAHIDGIEAGAAQ